MATNCEGEDSTTTTNTNGQHDPLHAEQKQERREVSPPRIKQWLLKLVLGSYSDDDIIKGRKNHFKKRLLAVSLVAVMLASLLRRRRRIKASPNVDVPLWPIGSLIEWWRGPEFRRSPRESTMSLLWAAARDGVIQHALIGSSTIFFQTKRPAAAGGNTWNRAILPSNNESIRSGLLEALSEGGAAVSAIPESIWSKLATPLLAALPFVYLVFLYRMMKNQFGGEDISSKLTNSTRKLWGSGEKDRTTFADVAGLGPVIEDMSEVVSYLSNPSLYKSIGARPPRGVLLHGPPGSGKTLLARAVAGEAMCDSFTAVSGSMFVEMYVGRGAARIRSLFAKARRDALHRRKLNRAASWWSDLFGFSSPVTTAALQRPACAILFIDELDAVAKARSSDSIHGNDEREQTLNQLLTEMDGFDSGRSKTDGRDGRDSEDEVTLIVIAASNRVDVIDAAILRRFDRQILVGYPNEEGRKAILQVHAKKIQCSSNIDWDILASSEFTEKFSGADLRNVVNEAALFAIREQSSTVEQAHLMQGARRIGQMKNRTSTLASPFPTCFASID